MELKFRAWHKEHKRYYEVVEISFRNDFKTVVVFDNDETNEAPFDMFTFDEVILEQYTGLKDKNDKEIYEGTIIRFDDPNNAIYVVKFHNGSFGVWVSSDVDYFLSFDILTHHDPKVLGNIQENKELLK